MTTLTREERKLPLWIWHADRERRPAFTLARRFVADRPLNNVVFRAAYTGAVTISVDGAVVFRQEETAGNVDAFRRVDGFPSVLEAGEHEIKLELACTAFVPLAEVNGYLRDRRVGAIGFLEADDWWLVTDDRWEADGDPAAVVCLLGEEPYGDLDDSPEWFVQGGFGDIEAFPIGGYAANAIGTLKAACDGDRLLLLGTCEQDADLATPGSEQLQLFYHLRKQEQWKAMRTAQKAADLARAPYADIDLGREYNCRFQVRNAGANAVKVLWNGAESIAELDNYDGCMTETFEAAGGETFWTLPQGMRYVRLILLGAPGTEIRLEIRFESVHVGLNQVGSLRAEDSILNEIYEVSAHTSRICHQIGLWDGIKRDRLNWTFDFYLAAKSGYFVWDDSKVLRRAVSELGIGTPYGSWMNGICEYTLWWIKTVCEYFFHTGDKSFVLEMKEPLARHAAWIRENMDETAGGIKAPANVLIEWAPLTAEEKSLGLQAIFAMTRNDLRALLEAVPELGFDCDWKLAELDEDRFLLASNGLATSVLGIASGYVSERKARAFLESCELRDPLTPLSAYQLAECYSRHEMHEHACRVIEEIWGGMLKRGATTFWEAYTIDASEDFHDSLTTYTAYGSYRMSLCHAWSSTPIKWISETVLGVQPLEPGFATVVFKPVPVGGIRACEGTVGTPRGPVRVQWRIDERGDLAADIQAPEGIRVIRADAGASSADR